MAPEPGQAVAASTSNLAPLNKLIAELGTNASLLNNLPFHKTEIQTLLFPNNLPQEDDSGKIYVVPSKIKIGAWKQQDPNGNTETI